jgi:hypothetical protein
MKGVMKCGMKNVTQYNTEDCMEYVRADDVTKSGRKCWMMRPEAFRRQNEKPG